MRGYSNAIMGPISRTGNGERQRAEASDAVGLKTHIRGYNAHWKDALEPAIDDLVAAGVMERQGRKIALTEHDKEDVVS